MTVILFLLKPLLYVPVSSWVLLFYDLIVYIIILFSHDWKRKENRLFFMKIGLKIQTIKEKRRVKPWYVVAMEPKPHHVH